MYYKADIRPRKRIYHITEEKAKERSSGLKVGKNAIAGGKKESKVQELDFQRPVAPGGVEIRFTGYDLSHATRYERGKGTNRKASDQTLGELKKNRILWGVEPAAMKIEIETYRRRKKKKRHWGSKTKNMCSGNFSRARYRVAKQGKGRA